jgi:hypothetical protein
VYYDCELLAHATRTATRRAVVMLDVVLREGNQHVMQPNRLPTAPSTFVRGFVPFGALSGLSLAPAVRCVPATL